MLPRAILLALSAAGICGAVLGAVSCSSVNDSRIGINNPGFNPTTFQPLGDFLLHRCGTLDCHGQEGRNLRIWGCSGMRLDAGQQSTCVPNDAGGGFTTTAEYEATYRSLVGLEPQLMSAVYSGCSPTPDGGPTYPPLQNCHPETLTFVEKARGEQAHKGGQLICLQPPCPAGVPNPNPYDPQDVCIVTWLEGAVDMNQCGNALAIPTFPMPGH